MSLTSPSPVDPAGATGRRQAPAPAGAHLPDAVFERRHHWVVGVLVGLVVGLVVWVVTPEVPRSAVVPRVPLLLLAVWIAVAALAALHPWQRLSTRASRAVRATSTSAGCFGSASLVVALTGGVAEAHFLFFVLVPLVALYEMVLPFVVAVGFVFLELVVVGSLWPAAVFGDVLGAGDDVWTTAALHSALFAAGCAGSLMTWSGARTARREAAELVSQLSHRATHDPLTGLADRAGLAQVLDAALTGAPQDLAVVVMDLNRFKDVNDTLGHDAGDELLRGVARVMEEAVSGRGVLARLGGDEFALVLPGAGGSEACAAAERLREQVRERSTVAGIALDLDLSAGVALHVAGGALDGAGARSASGELLRHADIAMYAAKRGGGGAVVYDPAMDHHSTARLEAARDLRTAIAQRDQLVLHYQPKISLVDGAARGASGRLVGVEALVRWQHPVRGFMPPGDFIPLLETTDLVHSFTAHMVDMALDQAQAWYLSGHEVPIAVNAFPRCLTHPDFLPHVAHALHVRGLPAHLLRLEITEDALVADPETASAVITELREMGVSTSIDDFGTGYSSLSYLRRLPVDEVKLDRSFVTGLGSGGEGGGGDEVLVASIIDLAHRLGMQVVAEGVEDPAETLALRALGCDVAQGYLFARPAPAAAIAPELLATARRTWRPPAQPGAPTGETTGPASAGLGSSSG